MSDERLKALSENAVNQFLYMNTDGDEAKVIRCKDCKYRAKGLPYCAYFGETDFCSYGKRRETK